MLIVVAVVTSDKLLCCNLVAVSICYEEWYQWINTRFPVDVQNNKVNDHRSVIEGDPIEGYTPEAVPPRYLICLRYTSSTIV